MRSTQFAPAKKSAVFVVATALLSGRALAVDCTFDQEHQTQVIAVIAKTLPGGTADDAWRLATWTDPSVGTTTFEFGGCVDFGSRVTRTTLMDSPRTRAQVFALARELATRFWDNDLVSAGVASSALVTGLANGTFTVQKGDDGETFLVQEPGYIQLYVQHQFENRTDRVSIGWQAAF